MPATHGRAVAPSSDDSTTAPQKPPTAPGTVMIRTVRQSTLPKRQCETPDTKVVPSSARCTVAEAAAGAVPAATSRVVEVSPYAIPSAPSTSLVGILGPSYPHGHPASNVGRLPQDRGRQVEPCHGARPCSGRWAIREITLGLSVVIKPAKRSRLR